ncbi:MAG: AMP-dependent synthetase and ligase [Actinomycetia bacterium]|nr:AMP-dependent synthetase and ligase [Actinomycetes bacterium]
MHVDVGESAGSHPDLRIPVAVERLTLGRFVDDLAARFGGREAVVSGETRWTFADLRREVRAAARGFVAAGVTKGEHVAVLAGSSSEWVSAVFGAAAIGAVVIPISSYATTEERHEVLADCDAALLVCEERLQGNDYVADLLDAVPALTSVEPGDLLVEAFPHLRRVVTFADASEAAGVEPWHAFLARGQGVSDALLDGLVDEVDPEDDALILYTSGSTGAPKAVVHRHRAPVLQSYRLGELTRTTPDDRVFSALPLFWCAGFAMGFGGPLAMGAAVVLQEVVEPETTLQLLEQERITTLHAPPHVAARLAEHPDLARRDLSALVRLSARSPLHAALGRTADTWDPASAYGMSECFTVVTGLPADEPASVRHGHNGPALPGVDLRILDPVTGDVLPTGESGEIVVRGPSLMRGYYHQPPEAAFDAEGFFHTRDLGHLDRAGMLHWDGRLTRMIRSRGVNVAPVEIEEILGRWGRLRLVRVLGVPHPTHGDAVIACVAPQPDDPLQEDDVLEYLRGRLASYKVPHRALLLDPSAFGLTDSDKVGLASVEASARRALLDSADLPADWREHLNDYRPDDSCTRVTPPENPTATQEHR